MTIITGTISQRLLNCGTKSEGNATILKCTDGKEYMLYRSGQLPTDDDYFTGYDGKTVTVEGNSEDATGHFLVTSITAVADAADGKDE